MFAWRIETLATIWERLEEITAAGTPSEIRLARYFIDRRQDLPFETAASIAADTALSPMTVGRFLRRLGFQGLDGFKAEMRADGLSSAWQISDTMDVLRRDLREGRLLAELMAEQIETLHRLYDLSNRPEWSRAVEAIMGARDIFVASYQNIGGIARYFTEQLVYARDGVRYMDGQNGTYAELLGRPPEGTLLILIDCRRFASKSRRLAESAVAAGHQVLLVTDQYCRWAEDAGGLALILPATRHRTWDSFMSLAALLDFLVTSVVIASGDDIKARTETIEALQDRFGDFSER